MASDSWIAASMRQSDAEIDMIAARPLGKRGAASRRSSVSSRRLCGAHNSAIAGGQDPFSRRGYRNRGIGIAGTTTPQWWKRSCQGTA
jgi:hypothetical protein